MEIAQSLQDRKALTAMVYHGLDLGTKEKDMSRKMWNPNNICSLIVMCHCLFLSFDKCVMVKTLTLRKIKWSIYIQFLYHLCNFPINLKL